MFNQYPPTYPQFQTQPVDYQNFNRPISRQPGLQMSYSHENIYQHQVRPTMEQMQFQNAQFDPQVRDQVMRSFESSPEGQGVKITQNLQGKQSSQSEIKIEEQVKASTPREISVENLPKEINSKPVTQEKKDEEQTQAKGEEKATESKPIPFDEQPVGKPNLDQKPVGVNKPEPAKSSGVNVDDIPIATKKLTFEELLAQNLQKESDPDGIFGKKKKVPVSKPRPVKDEEKASRDDSVKTQKRSEAMRHSPVPQKSEKSNEEDNRCNYF